jgi:2,3-dihydroxybenzoate decarboxylase
VTDIVATTPNKIALEEHFLTPDLISYWEASVEDLPPDGRRAVLARLTDFSGPRLDEMDRAGIRLAILSVAGPGVQVEPDRAKAVDGARKANDALARIVQDRPDRYAGFAHLAMQDPEAAAAELQRCVTRLGFKGAMIDGQTHGRYLDEDSFAPFWERAEALDVPVYLHPADPEAPYAAWKGYKQLTRATWGWTVETATHALRMVFGGTFERFPKARLILGHMGETLPYQLWRLDSRSKLYAGYALPLSPSEYIRRNIAITTSGMCSDEPLLCAIASMGDENVMFSVDYPFEHTDPAAHFIDRAPVSELVRAKLCHGNATRILRL